MSTATATETQPSTGLDQSFKAAGGGKKRAAAKTLPARMGEVWAAVTVTGKEYDTNPEVVCASAAEHNWSIYGQIKSEKRCGLSHAKSDKLVYCHEALHLKEKLQKAGYKAKMVKWDSDTDSDESDDEKDLMQ